MGSSEQIPNQKSGFDPRQPLYSFLTMSLNPEGGAKSQGPPDPPENL
jgi:hypothetical protein